MLRRAPSSDVRGVWIFTSGKVTCVSTAESKLLNVSEFGGKPAPAFLTVVAGGGCGRPDPRAVPPTDRHVPQPGQPPGARASPSASQPGPTKRNKTPERRPSRCPRPRPAAPTETSRLQRPTNDACSARHHRKARPSHCACATSDALGQRRACA